MTINNDTVTESSSEVFAQDMTDAIYNAKAAMSEAIGGILETEEASKEDENTLELNTTTTTEDSSIKAGNEKTDEVDTKEDIIMDNSDENNVSNTFIFESSSASSSSPQLVKEQVKYCQRILKGLKRHREAGPFLLPVDPVALGIPDYLTVIKQPMDLGTISKKCDLNEYIGAEGFISDVRLMLTNCFTYNAPDSQVTKMGRNLEKYFNTAMSKMPMEVGSGISGVSSSMSSISSTLESPGTTRPKRESVVPAGTIRRTSSPSSGASLTFCSSVLRELMKKTNSHLNWPFMMPVDPIALGIPDYFEVVPQPMDLGTIRKKLDTGIYSKPEQFESDVRLVFSNCYSYNPPESDVHKMAKALESIFDQKIVQKPAAPHKQQSSSASASTGHSNHHPSSTTITATNSNIMSSSNSMNSSSSSGAAFIPSSASQLIPGLDALEDDSEKILAINHQIQILQAELNYLLLNRKSSSSASIGSVGKSSSGPKPKKKSTVPPSALNNNKSTGNTANTSSAVPEEMSFDEKRQLSEDVSNLQQDNMMRVLEIIQEFMPNLRATDSDVIELDIEALDVRTLRALQGYIWECHNPGKKRKSIPINSASKGSKKAKEHHQQHQQQVNTIPGNNSYDSSSSSSSEDDD